MFGRKHRAQFVTVTLLTVFVLLNSVAR